MLPTFKRVAEHIIYDAEKSPATIRQWRLLLKRLEPLHNQPVQDIDSPELYQAVKAVEEAGARQVALRCVRFASLVLRYSRVNGWRQKPDCTGDLADMLKRSKPVPRAAVTTEEGLQAAMAKVLGYTGPAVSMALLRMAPHVFLRPNELMGARWAEFDLEGKIWTIPASRMKMRREHVVPLSRQVLSILDTVAFEDAEFVFPGAPRARVNQRRRRREHVCKGTLGRIQVAAGLAPSVCTPHGWRSTASTLLGELGYDRDLIELQLAHKRGGVAGIYNRAERLEERAAMMQRWSDYLESLTDEQEVEAV